jgi:hypothetical protein
MISESRYLRILAIVILILGNISYSINSHDIEFGISQGNSVSDGFVFFDGNLLDRPYIFKREGLTLSINGKIFEPFDINITQKALSDENDVGKWTRPLKEKLVAKLDYLIDSYQKNLQQGYSYIFFTRGGDIILDPYQTAYDLPEMVDVLNSKISKSEKIDKINQKNWSIKVKDVRIEDFVNTFELLDNFNLNLSLLKNKLLKTENFGEESGKPIEKGFLFYYGRYIESPYIVSRKGLGVFINDVLVRKPIQWSLGNVGSEVDPKTPVWITKNSVFDDYRGLLVEKFQYLSSHFSEDEAQKKYLEFLHTLPFVESLKYSEKDQIVEIKTFIGETIPMTLSSSFIERNDKNKNSVLQNIKIVKENLENSLSRGACLFLFDGYEATMSNEFVNEKLGDIVQILNSQKSINEKKEQLKQLNFSIPEKNISELIANFKTSDKLNNRVANIKGN